MPYVMNGCGTWYYGKKNLEAYEGRCRACGTDGNLRSYDTTLYFVFFFIPVLPLKKRHIIDDCPLCKRHFAFAPAQWQRIKEEEINKAFEEFRADPRNEDLAKTVLTRCVSYRDRERFAGFATEVARFFPANKELLISIGQMQIFLGLLDDAEKTFLRVRQLDPKNEVAREGLAEVYIRMLKPEKAEPLLAHIMDQGIPDKVYYFNRLAGAYQALGRHSQALESLDCALNLVPQLEKDKMYKKMRRTSDKHLVTGKEIKPQWLQAKGQMVSSEKRDVSGRIARTIPYIIFSALMLTYLISAFWIGEHRQVYIVNGLKKPYSVRINGQNLRLIPLHPIPIQIEEGSLRIEPVKGCNTLEPASVEIITNFFSRPFVTRTFVLNPDKAAIITRQTTHYIAKDRKSATVPKNKTEFFANKQLYTFGSVDYLFKPFPVTIKVESSSATERSRLYIFGQDGDLTEAERLAIYLQQVDKEESVLYLKERLKHEPQSVILIFGFVQLVDPETFIATARPYLAQRPVYIHWHRAYQNVADKTSQSDKLETEYLNMLRAEPNDKTLQYLAGRASHNINEYVQLMNSAASPPNPLPRAMGALCYAYMGNGKFKNALEMIRKAHELDPQDAFFKDQLIKALIACKAWDEVLELITKEQRRYPKNYSYILSEATILSQSGRFDEAKKRINSSFEAFYGSSDHPVLKTRKAELDNRILYTSGAYKQAIGSWIQLRDKWFEMAQAIQDGNMAQAEQIYRDNDFTKLLDHTLLYIGEVLADRQAEASSHLDALVSLLEKDSWQHRRFAEALKSGVEKDPNELLSLPMGIEEKRVVLLTMAFRFPNYKKQYLDMALRLWYEETPPVHLIKWLSELK
ncbi:MAG: hypothetical protein ACYSWP_11350 [Planctomycetota bacterium]|jgi:tetratricopeptide (TPR) repeat protein